MTRAVSDTEMVALLKRQQAAKSSTQGTLTSAQILAQAGIQVCFTITSLQFIFFKNKINHESNWLMNFLIKEDSLKNKVLRKQNI